MSLFASRYQRKVLCLQTAQEWKPLSRMMGTTGDGLHDHLMDYTRAVSGATFFALSPRVIFDLIMILRPPY